MSNQGPMNFGADLWSSFVGSPFGQAGDVFAAVARHNSRTARSAREAGEAFEAVSHPLRNPSTTPKDRAERRAKNKSARKARRNNR